MKAMKKMLTTFLVPAAFSYRGIAVKNARVAFLQISGILGCLL